MARVTSITRFDVPDGQSEVTLRLPRVYSAPRVWPRCRQVSNTDYGVNRDGANNLSGFAWGTNVGWINFDPADGGVSVDPSTGRLVGYAWGENVGWIRFDPRYSLTGPPPTAALVTHFSVRSVPGGNLVRWETATEARVTGFNVQRAVEPNGPLDPAERRPDPGYGQCRKRRPLRAARCGCDGWDVVLPA